MILDWMTKEIRWSPGFLCLSHWKMITLNSLEILMRYVFLEDLRNNYLCISVSQIINIQVMTREELIGFCRYYKGEKENPFSISPVWYIWNIEKEWVDKMMINNAECQDLSLAMNHYVSYGFKDFEKNDHIPITLKSMLLSLLEKWTEGMVTDKDFREFYDKWKNRSI